MNKRGALLHWILFGIIGAVALFYTLTADVDINVAAKGAWSLSFLEYTYYPAQKESFLLQLKATDLGKIAAEELAAHGGFDSQEESECGDIDAVPLWNKADIFCFPDAIENAQQLLRPQMPGFEFSFTDNFLIGKGNQKSKTSDSGTYFYKEEFVADLGYSFSEYSQLKQEAQALLFLCKENTAACLKEKKPTHWHYRSCQNEPEIPADATEMVFCVESPRKYKIDDKIVEYSFALDFSSSEPIIS